MPSTPFAALDSMPSKSFAPRNPIPSSLAGILHLNIANLIQLFSKITPQRSVRKGRIKQHAHVIKSTPV